VKYNILICPRLQAADFKPRRDQRKALNRWNKYVLGQEYIRKAAMLAPKTREYDGQYHVFLYAF
jgi:hypothetical protein